MDSKIQKLENDFFKKMHKGALLTSGTLNDFNTMTIGWMTFGVIWGIDTVTVYVRPSRYTYEFMEKNKEFTISFFDDKYKNELMYLGTKSGRETNKIKDVNFHPIVVGDSITFEEANTTILCTKMYSQDFDFNNIPDEIKNIYYKDLINSDKNDCHRFYFGAIKEIK